MKIAVISRSDSKGGAAIASRRLTEALKAQGADATLVIPRFPLLKPLAFVAERLQILFSLFRLQSLRLIKRNLWKADSGTFGLPLWRLPQVKEADVVILNWINQGTLSLRGIRRLGRMGKKILWVMHDMWPLTGVCHHAMDCKRFRQECGCCPLLGSGSAEDLSHRVWKEKHTLYSGTGITFVAVSNWLAGMAGESSLLCRQRIAVVPNAFQPEAIPERSAHETKKVLFAAATLDNWIKGLDIFRSAVNFLSSRNTRFEVILMGAVKDPAALEGFDIPVKYMGEVSGDKALAEVFTQCDVVVNCSDFENLPGTLIEGQAYGAVPVSFDRGGQSDIIEHLSTGYLAPWSSDPSARAEAIARGIEWALGASHEVRNRMRLSVGRFSYPAVAKAITELLQNRMR